jgi:membrane-anchored glycerophosphoryl diester phosphodiesterase (GDPDase)
VLLIINNNLGAGLVLLLVGLPCLVVVSLFVSTKISLAAPAIVLEGHGVFAGLRRSFTLTKGAFWRILGITLLAGLLAGITGYLLEMPFLLIDFAIMALSGPDTESGQMGVTLLSHLSALLAGSITTPFMAAVTGLLYIDRRMRLEALDVVLLRDAQTNPAPRI